MSNSKLIKVVFLTEFLIEESECFEELREEGIDTSPENIFKAAKRIALDLHYDCPKLDKCLISNFPTSASLDDYEEY